MSENVRRVRLPDCGYDPRWCPRCGGRMISIHPDQDPARGWYKRWRKCKHCGRTITTIELIMLPGRTGKLRPAYVALDMNEEETHEQIDSHRQPDP